ncbi:MAG: phosphoribosylformylglycinamidine synthase [Halobacteriovorax sp.]|nr:phosphoribosylformylglycinamidine synthase [Halobacteriovorax sp.]|tara:strand:- start:2615 stop:3382 length:768 start_codon:yes stop_codon:yes gene_type:complete
MLVPKVLVLTGEGINCEKETAFAFNKAGAESTIMTINELIKNPSRLFDYHILALPGGFSYGDEIGSGQVFSLKLKNFMGEELKKFIAQKRPVIGICNGFQILMKLDVFNIDGHRKMGLAPNRSGKFINKWAGVKVEESSVCLWTKSLKTESTLPIRHGEGRIVFLKDEEEKSYKTLKDQGQVALTYTQDVNGSYNQIAGVCDPTGVVFGLMPHPEADLFKATHAVDNRNPLEKSWGFGIFKNAVDYISKNEGTWK